MYKFFVALTFFVSSCSSKVVNVNTEAPSNLNVTATISTDNSGNVSFKATATNVTSFDFDFGDGTFENVASGEVTYKYTSSGTFNVNVIAKNGSGKTISKSIDVTVNVVQSLIWSDEFNTPGLPNSAKWGYDIGTGSNGWGNNELEYYTNRIDNAEVSGGVLKIKAKRETFNGSPFTSARLISKGKFDFKYGKIEFSAKLPVGVGTWPALWMLGNNISTVGWPACGEIDVMEHRGMELNKIFGTVHHPGHSGGNADGGTINISGATTAFHKYTCEWSASAIKFYVDDNLYYSFPNNSSVPFNHNFFIIMNLAIGGNFAGPVDPSLNSATMEVDYVRVYN